MAKLIQETGKGIRRVRRSDGRIDEYGGSSHWRVRYGVFFPGGSRAIRSKIGLRKSDAMLLRNEAGRLERLTRTGTATQQDLGHFLRLGFVSEDDYLPLGGTNLELSWDKVLDAYIQNSYERCALHTNRNNVFRAQRIVEFLGARLVRHHTRLKNRVHGVLHRNLIPGCPRSDLFGKAGRQWLTTQAVPQLPPHEQDIVLATLRQFESLSAELARIDRTLAALALDRASVRRLMTIPGIDGVMALTVVAAIGDIHRAPYWWRRPGQR